MPIANKDTHSSGLRPPKSKSLTRPKEAQPGLLALFKKYEAALRHHISGFFVAPHDVDDISQEAFLRTYERSESQPLEQPKSFMFRVATNLILSEFRRSSYKLSDYIEDLGEEYEPLDITDPHRDLETQTKLALFNKSLNSLPEQCREVMILRKIEGLSIKQISEQIDMPISTINYNLAKGMACCDAALKEWQPKANTKSVANSKRVNSNEQ